jgi:hypothetical protein
VHNGKGSASELETQGFALNQDKCLARLPRGWSGSMIRVIYYLEMTCGVSEAYPSTWLDYQFVALPWCWCDVASFERTVAYNA